MGVLSPRLQKIFDLAIGPELWDIGCDHGLLAVHNVQYPKFQKVMCVDKSPRVIDGLPARFIKKYLFTSDDFARVEFHCRDGVQLDWSRVQGSVAIAGVGCQTIVRIIESVPIKYWDNIHWILSPQDGPQLLEEAIQTKRRSKQVFDVIERGRRRPIFDLPIPSVSV